MAKHITLTQFEKLWQKAKSLFVMKEDGKGLSTNDFDDVSKLKLNGIEDGAEKNVIKGVKTNGTTLEVDADGFVNVVADAVSVEDATDDEIDAVLNNTNVQ